MASGTSSWPVNGDAGGSRSQRIVRTALPDFSCTIGANWRTIGKVEDDGYISESTNWRVVGKVDTSGYVTESTNWTTVGKVDATSPRLAGGAALLLLLSPI